MSLHFYMASSSSSSALAGMSIMVALEQQSAECMHAYIPQIVVPFIADQPFWGSRVYAIGVAPKPIRVNQLSVDKMLSAIAEAESKGVLERAQVIGQDIRSEDGVMNAVNLIELYAMNFHESA